MKVVMWLCVVVVLVGCDRNSAPAILSLDVPERVEAGSKVTFTIDVVDADNDLLEYLWFVDGVRWKGADERLIWYAPGVAGAHVVTAGVDDGTEQISTWRAFTVYVPDPLPAVRVLIDQTRKVENLSYRYWKLDLRREDLLTIRIESDRDITVYLLDGREFQSYERNETFSAEISKTDVYDMTMDYQVRASGTYYLVLSNQYSWLTDKVVAVYVTVTR